MEEKVVNLLNGYSSYLPRKFEVVLNKVILYNKYKNKIRSLNTDFKIGREEEETNKPKNEANIILWSNNKLISELPGSQGTKVKIESIFLGNKAYNYIRGKR